MKRIGKRGVKKRGLVLMRPSIGQRWGRLIAAIETAEMQLTYAEFELLPKEAREHAERLRGSIRRLGVIVRSAGAKK